MEVERKVKPSRSRIFLDGANPSLISALKKRVEEDTNYEHITSYLKKQYSSVYDLQFLEENMFVIPVPFNKEHKHMLAHCKAMMEYHNGQVAINPRHTKLITSFCTAVENGEGILDKDATNHDDLFDAFRMSLPKPHIMAFAWFCGTLITALITPTEIRVAISR